jgi:hypothetical protein
MSQLNIVLLLPEIIKTQFKYSDAIPPISKKPTTTSYLKRLNTK